MISQAGHRREKEKNAQNREIRVAHQMFTTVVPRCSNGAVVGWLYDGLNDVFPGKDWFLFADPEGT